MADDKHGHGHDHGTEDPHYHDHDHAHEHRNARRASWPVWLLVPLGIFGVVAVTQMGDRDDTASRSTTTQERAASTTLTYNGQTLTNDGSNAVQYADDQMVQVGTSASGVILYRHATRPWGGGGGGPSTKNPVYMKTGHDSYLPLRPVDAAK